MSGTADKKQAQSDRDDEEIKRILNMTDAEVLAQISPEDIAKTRAFLDEVLADFMQPSGKI